MKKLHVVALSALLTSLCGLTAAQAQIIPCSQLPALTGDVTTPGASCATTIASGAVTSGKMASGAAIGNIGYTPANRAGDTISGSFTFSTLNAILQTVANVGGEAHPWNVTRKAGVNTYQYLTSGTMGVWDTELGGPVWGYDFASHLFSATKFAGDGSQLTGILGTQTTFIGTGTAPITENVSAKLDRDLISAGDYAATSPANSCATDSKIGLQNAINKAGSGTLKVPAGNWCFTGPLNVTANAFKMVCDVGARFWKIDAGSNGIVVGDGGTEIDDVKFVDCVFGTKSGVTPSGGAMILAQNTRNFVLDNSFVGTRNTSNNGAIKQSYNGIVMHNLDADAIRGGGVWGAVNDSIQAYSDSGLSGELHFNGGIEVGGCGGKGVEIGGGLGGIYLESISVQTCATGLVIDKSLSTTTNREIFISRAATFDSSTGQGIYAAPNSYGFIFMNGWSASNGANGMLIDTPQSSIATTVVTGGILYNNREHGLAVLAGKLIATGGNFLGNGTGGAGSGILVYGTGVVTANITGIGAYSNANYGIDDQANAGVTKWSAIDVSGNGTAPTRSINGVGGLVYGLPTSCAGQPTGALRNNGGVVNVC
jgi:hypothetical protein